MKIGKPCAEAKIAGGGSGMHTQIAKMGK